MSPSPAVALSFPRRTVRTRWIKARRAPWAPAVLLLGLLWLLIFNQQRLEWSVNVVYAYGWAVPAMAVYLLRERWLDRPSARPPEKISARLLLAVSGLLLLAYLPLRVIQEANPDWVKINWTLTALAGGLAWLAIAASGGVRQARHCAFPLLFCFTALPWPVWVDTWLVQELMRGNAAICAELLGWMGTPALAEGNLIQVGERWLNVEEACSGIRSLQTAFMMSVFLGEFYRLGVLRRLGLVAASFGVALLLNIARTLILARLTLGDESALGRWHDPVGVVAMILCLTALWGLSEWFRPRATPPAAPAAEGSERAPFPRWFAAAGIAWLVVAETASGAWYAWHERRVPPAPAWEIAWPENAPEFARGVFAERTLALLKFNQGDTASWRTAEGRPWQMYALHWSPGRVSKFLSSAHHPTVCLPATGLSLVRDLGDWDCVVNGVRLPFTSYLFAQGARDVYVFHAIVEDRPLRADESANHRQVGTEERLRSVWRGERNLGQHVIGIALLDATSSADARAVARGVLASILRPVAAPSL